VLRRLAAVAGDPAYNYILHTATDSESYHWHWEILPRVTGIAGYELATGYYLNPLPPEVAAEQLRRKADSPQRHKGHKEEGAPRRQCEM